MRPELEALERRFVLARQPVVLPLGEIVLEKPRSADDLISEADFAKDDRLPYWADIWSASIVLATYLEQEAIKRGVAPVAQADSPLAAPPAAPFGARALELGCGLGLVTIAALRAGCDVLASDYYEDALRFAARNALREAGREPATRMIDWRDFPDDLGTFDLVLAADVLYEKPYAPLIAEALRRTMAREGRALIADQGRVALGSFLEEAVARRLAPRIVHHETRPTVPPSPAGSAVHSITVYELRHA